MIFIKSFTYSTSEWTLNKVYLNKQNLVVGQNATGKTKMLESISTVINTMLMRDNNWKGKTTFKAQLEFDGDYSLIYDLDFSDGKFTYEKLVCVNSGRTLITRTTQSCTFYDEENITLPEQSTALVAKQDVLKYPEAASVMQWAQTTRSITFSLLHIDKFKQMHLGTISMEEMYESLDEREHGLICNYMNKLDYHLDYIQESIINENIKFVIVKEKGLNTILPDAFLSNGMYRVLYILFYMHYISKQNVKCILVDDIGEGLDYDRSINLGRIVFDYCSEHDIQLIATSNDNFLMNVVPLNNWIILNRHTSIVDSISAITHKEIFDKFMKTGLRNFDIIRTDFIERNNKKDN